MICPNCQNEKLQDTVCSRCGLDQKTALLKAADRYREQEKTDLALRAFDQYLALEPGDLEVARKAALLSCSLALNLKDPALFEKADRALARLLEAHWDWQVGHENRLSLGIGFDKTGPLLAWYKTMKGKDPGRAEVCDRMLKMIQLTVKFQGERPVVPEGLEETDNRTIFLKNLTVFIGALALAGLIKLLWIPPNYQGLLSWPGVVLTSFFIYVTWTLFVIWRLSTRRKKPGPPLPPLQV